MLQEITISSNSSTSLKSLLESTLRNEKKLFKHGIDRTVTRLKNYEEEFGMSSDEFDRKFR